MGVMPFSLTFRIEAMIPVEIGVLSAWVTKFDEQINSKRWLSDLDLLDEA